MVRYCFIIGCKSTNYKAKEDNIVPATFFGFPKSPVLREKWIEVLVSSGHSQEHVAKISKSSCICSLHFAENCIKTNGFSSSQLKPDSVPTIFLNTPRESTSDMEVTSLDTPFVKTESVDQCKENIFENAQCDLSIHKTPSKNRICYAGDIKFGETEKMSPRTLMKSMNVLKRSCDKKNKIINRLRVQHCRQKKKIESLEALLHELRTKGLLSSTSSDTVKKMNNEEKKKRATKTTRRQYEIYLEELRANRAFRENKLDATQPNIIEESWQNLCQKLNASGGPVKSVQEWKRVFTYWKSQIKSKARELKVAQRETGNKENKVKPLNDLENMLLNIIGHVVIDGMSDIAQFGIVDDEQAQTTHDTHIENEKLIEETNYESIVRPAEQNNASILDTNINQPNNQDFEIINDKQVIANKSSNKKFKVDNKIMETRSPKNKSKSLVRCLREYTDNKVKETGQYQVLCEIRNYLKNIEEYEAKRFKLEKLKTQVKYPDYEFILSSDSE